MASEFDRIHLLQRIFGAPPCGVSIGIGDDAAVFDMARLSPRPQYLVWTLDACVERVHFRREMLSWHDLGWRSFMAAASDLAAMAALPLGALCGLALSDDIDDAALDAIASGQATAAAALGTAVVGGNLSRSGEISITTTLIGACARPVCRSGAKPGDLLVVAGDLGLAGAGLRILQDGMASSDLDHKPSADEAVKAWRRPWARIAEGVKLGKVATAQIDVSDGLMQDAGHIANESGIRIEIDVRAAISSRLRAVSEQFGLDAAALALGGGEDYALLATIPERDLSPDGVTVIGRCCEGQGVLLVDEQGEYAAKYRGFDHFQDR